MGVFKFCLLFDHQVFQECARATFKFGCAFNNGHVAKCCHMCMCGPVALERPVLVIMSCVYVRASCTLASGACYHAMFVRQLLAVNYSYACCVCAPTTCNKLNKVWGSVSNFVLTNFWSM